LPEINLRAAAELLARPWVKEDWSLIDGRVARESISSGDELAYSAATRV